MELPEALFLPIEGLLNRGITASLTAQAIARTLEGQRLDVSVDGVPVAFRVRIEGGAARVTSPGTAPATAAIAGPPLAMFRLLSLGLYGAGSGLRP